MERYQDWPLRLNLAIEDARSAPFDWRTHNCATFAADVVEAMTGERLHDTFAALHGHRRHAIAASKRMRALVSAQLPVMIAPPYAQRGDVVYVEIDGTAGLGICNGNTAVCLGPDGLAFVPMEAAQCAWRI